MNATLNSQTQETTDFGEMKAGLFASIVEAAEVVGSTFGPNGKASLLYPRDGHPYFTHDGITVLRAWKPRSLSSKLLVDVAEKVVQKAGDGTTTVCLLVAGLLKNGLDLRPDLEMVLGVVKGWAKEAEEGDIIAVATAAAKNETLGRGIGKLIYELGPTGFVRGIEGPEFKAYHKPGYELGTGLLLPQQLTKQFPFTLRHRQSISLQNPLVCIVGHTISAKEQVLPILKAYEEESRMQRPLALVCTDIEKGPIEFLVKNFFERNPPLPVFIIRGAASENPEERYEILRDLQFATGCPHVYSKLSGKTISTKGVGFAGGFGEAVSIELSMNTARFVVDTALNERIEEIKGQEGVEERIAKLSGAIGVVEFSAETRAETKNVELAIEDAVLAAQGALREGYVYGGASFWKQLAEKFPTYAPAFQELSGRLPEGEVKDSAEVARQCFLSATSLVGQLLDTQAIIHEK